MNFIPCELAGGQINLGTLSLGLAKPSAGATGKIELGIRPEFLGLTEANANPKALPVTVVAVEDLGKQQLVHCLYNGQKVGVLTPEAQPLPNTPALTLRADKACLYENSQLICSAGELHENS